MNRSGLRFAALVALIGCGLVVAERAGFLLILRDPVARDAALESLRRTSAQPWAGPLFVLVYSAAVALLLPATVLTLLGGAAFGFWPGVLWVTLGANLGASLAFWLARRLGRAALQRMLGPRLTAFDRLAAVDGFQALLILRLIPVAPFSLLNFVAGLSTMPWRDYVVATALGILPGSVVYVLFADALLTGSAEASKSALLRVLGAGLLLGSFSLLTRWLLKRRPAGGS